MYHVLKCMLRFGIMGAMASCSPVDEQARAAKREQFISAHGHDPAALGQEYGHEAEAACSVRVDDYLKTIANYDFAWDENAQGILGTKFDKIITKSPGMGLIALKTTRVKLSNVFGAFQHTDIYCLYNAASNEVIKFSTYNPLLDLIDNPKTDDPPPVGDGNGGGEVIIYTPSPPSISAESPAIEAGASETPLTDGAPERTPTPTLPQVESHDDLPVSPPVEQGKPTI